MEEQTMGEDEGRNQRQWTGVDAAFAGPFLGTSTRSGAKEASRSNPHGVRVYP